MVTGFDIKRKVAIVGQAITVAHGERIACGGEWYFLHTKPRRSHMMKFVLAVAVVAAVMVVL